jgi:hypothetical protein
MANTYTLIASSTVGSGGAANIDFTSIPATYTDLCVLISPRSNRSATVDGLGVRFNNSTTNYSSVDIYGTGSGVGSQGNGGTTELNFWSVTGDTATANTFSNVCIYIPNYTAATGKSVSNDGVDENNATAAYMGLDTGYWNDTAAITSIKLFPTIGTLFVQYSTAYLYGIKNS